jgi:F-type H+-transporting ATPase subunit delta
MNKILAKRYAKALLAIGLEDGRYQEYGRQLLALAEEIRLAGPEGQALASAAYPRRLRSQILEAVLAKAELAPMAANFLRLLLDRDRFDLLGPACRSYLELVDERDGLIRGTLSTAAPLGPGEVSAVEGALSTMTGRRVRLEVFDDPSIIGGLVARLGDLVVDGSLRSRLERLGRLLSAA